jgi:hypothetical protein
MLWPRGQEDVMAGKKGRFSVNTNRIDPYKNFKFRMMVASALGAIASLGLLKKLAGGPASKKKSTYLTPGEIKEEPRPINSVGTSTAGRAKAKRKAGASGRKRSGPRKKGGAKRR